MLNKKGQYLKYNQSSLKKKKDLKKKSISSNVPNKQLSNFEGF